MWNGRNRWRTVAHSLWHSLLWLLFLRFLLARNISGFCHYRGGGSTVWLIASACNVACLPPLHVSVRKWALWVLCCSWKWLQVLLLVDSISLAFVQSWNSAHRMCVFIVFIISFILFWTVRAQFNYVRPKCLASSIGIAHFVHHKWVSWLLLSVADILEKGTWFPQARNRIVRLKFICCWQARLFFCAWEIWIYQILRFEYLLLLLFLGGHCSHILRRQRIAYSSE